MIDGEDVLELDYLANIYKVGGGSAAIAAPASAADPASLSSKPAAVRAFCARQGLHGAARERWWLLYQ